MWLDRDSAQVLGFVARRPVAEPIGLLFAARVPGEELAGLPELVVEGLQEADARALLDAVLTGPLDAQVRDRVTPEPRAAGPATRRSPRAISARALTASLPIHPPQNPSRDSRRAPA